MNKSLPLLIAGALPLAGCAMTDLLGGYGNRYDDPYSGRGGPAFEEMAADACGREASRYGRAAVTDVRRASTTTMRVTGSVEIDRYERRGFSCTYRDDGRIVDFSMR